MRWRARRHCGNAAVSPFRREPADGRDHYRSGRVVLPESAARALAITYAELTARRQRIGRHCAEVNV